MNRSDPKRFTGSRGNSILVLRNVILIGIKYLPPQELGSSLEILLTFYSNSKDGRVQIHKREEKCTREDCVVTGPVEKLGRSKKR